MSAKNGRPCKNCGSNEWYKNGACASCQKERGRKWYQQNKDKAKVNSRRWQQDNPDKVKEHGRQWRQRNPGSSKKGVLKWRQNPDNRKKESERNQQYYRDNTDKARVWRRRWARQNPDKIHEYQQQRVRDRDRERIQRKQWRWQHPDRERAQQNRRRTRETIAGGAFTAAEWKALVEHYDNKCLCCGRNDVHLTVDHIVPVSKGGTSNIENLQPLCHSCNSRKGNKTLDYRPDSGLVRWIQRKLFE